MTDEHVHICRDCGAILSSSRPGTDHPEYQSVTAFLAAYSGRSGRVLGIRDVLPESRTFEQIEVVAKHSAHYRAWVEGNGSAPANPEVAGPAKRATELDAQHPYAEQVREYLVAYEGRSEFLNSLKGVLMAGSGRLSPRQIAAVTEGRDFHRWRAKTHRVPPTSGTRPSRTYDDDLPF